MSRRDFTYVSWVVVRLTSRYRLDDPAIENAPVLVSWSSINQSAMYVWGINKSPFTG
mgnify:CR=1 FL=1